MTYLCVPITVEAIDSAIAEAKAARLAGADLVEFRIDGFVSEDDESGGGDSADAVRLVASSPLPCIVTCRDSAEGGAYHGDDETRARLFRAIIESDHPPQYVDIELAAIERSPALRRCVADASRRDAPRIIVSIHDFAERPADLNRRFSRIGAIEGASIVKVAYRARSLRDNLELFEVLQRHDRPTIALAMGEFGLMSRVLAPKFGAFLTFASLRSESATAPGQPTIHDLTHEFRFRSIDAATHVFGVIGWPTAQSLSPAIHNASFEACGFNGVYLPLPIPPEWEHFKATLGALIDDARLDFRGASVTIPHKEHLVRFAREHEGEGWALDSLAAAAGAANTIVRSDNGWLALNTDAPAIVECLRSALGDLRDRRIAILGAGGAARAAAAGLVGAGATVVVYNRTTARAERIAADLIPFADEHGGKIIAAPLDRLPKTCADAIINATPVGMFGGPDPDGRPIDLASLTKAPQGLVVFDTVYNPLETPLLRQARERGVSTIDGVAMFVRQAALQFEAWTGGAAPMELFDRIIRERLSHNV